jgi:mono/diheme cytochrome c family protein
MPRARITTARAALLLVSIGCGVTASSVHTTAAPPAQATPAVSAVATHRALIDRYCAGCHSERLRSGDVVLQGIDLSDVARSAETLEKVVRKLRTGTMPPPGAPQPDAASTASLMTFLEASLDRGASAHPNPGRPPAPHRLNRAEYANAIRDILDLDVDVASLLPPDDSGYGFDNIGDVLSVSPMLAERYLAAAQRISRIAVGDPALRPATDAFSVNKYLRQDDRVSEELPFSSRGGLAIRYYFPVDADYVVKVFLDRTYDGRVRGLGDAHVLEVRVNGEKVQQLTIGEAAASVDEASGGGGARPRASRAPAGDGAEIRIAAKAGPAVIGVTFLKKATEPEGMLRPRYAVTSYEYAGDAVLPPAIGSVEVRGPYEVKGPGESPSRQRIFGCRAAEKAAPAVESRCARQIVSTLARRAFRRSVSDGDVQPLMDFYQAYRKEASFDSAIEATLRRLLVSPDFLFRVERTPATASAGVYRIADVDLASRLSFFLWSSVPDDALMDAAVKGQLKQPAVLEKQVRRMLADRRAHALVENFAGQWLYLRNLRIHTPDPLEFPDFDENLRQALGQEVTLFFDSQLRENRPIPELLTAQYTFVNERLARHYGIPNIYGDHFRRVELTDPVRRGLLGKGAVLMVTSYPNRTSPVLRGKWLLENVLGAPPPPPPPNIPTLKENVAGQPGESVRQRLEQHRSNPSCASCHRVMDPLGFALENFDGIGRWRTSEAGTPIDASGSLIDGTRVDGPTTLVEALISRKTDFVGTVVQKLLTYALGRGVEYYDLPAVRNIVKDAAADNYSWSAIITGIVKSVPFQMRTDEGEGATR